MGFFVTTLPLGIFPHTHTGNSGGQVQGASFFRKVVFTMRSSSEWKVMTHSLPPGFSISMKSSRVSLSTSSSLLHSMRKAWKVCLDGCPFWRIFAGTAALMTSFNS
jgi:hypothetical protein